MKKSTDIHNLSVLLQQWYAEHKRVLPWRETTDPYKIWLSEVILQQTRVDQGSAYFQRFVRSFPTIESLASASEQEVLKLWQGLGYYSRARNLHAAAKQLVTDFNGKFPKKYSDIISLKGIGEYTAAAIASIAFNQPYAVVDGNVLRVISRLFRVKEPVNSAEGKKIITEIAQQLLDERNPAIHNQAIMDFGAMVCTPRQPRCSQCPLQFHCAALAEGSVLMYPVKIKAKKSTDRYFHYFHINHRDSTYIHKRDASDIWKNLYEFPLIETTQATDFTELSRNDLFLSWFGENPAGVFSSVYGVKHVLSHQNIHAQFYRVVLPDSEPFGMPENFIRISSSSISNYPVSRLIHKYLERFHH